MSEQKGLKYDIAQLGDDILPSKAAQTFPFDIKTTVWKVSAAALCAADQF